MPTAIQHRAKADKNKIFADYCTLNSGDQYFDWATTALFYAALHLIEAVLCRELNKHTGSHVERTALINSNKNIFSSRVRSYYKSLESLSRNARYTAIPINKQDTDNAKRLVTTIESDLLPKLP